MAISKDLNNLVINKIENAEVYDYMVRNNLINNDELYLVQGTDDENTVVDSSLSSTSENPVQNKVIKSKFDSIESNYETKSDASSKLTEAKTYADSAAAKVKSDLLNGAGTAYDTLKELGDLIVDNKDAIDVLEDVAAGKANASHTHGNITNAGAIGTTANKAVITTTNGVLTTGTVPIASGGTGATTAAAALTNLGITATASELNKLDGITATTAELNYVDGVTSNIQTQLDAKQATINGGASTITSSNLTASRALVSNSSGKVATSSVTSTELGYLSGVTSTIQTQLDGKQATVTGAATTITGSNLATNRALVSNGSGKVAVSDVTSTELGYLDGVTSNIQTQLDAKQATITGGATTITGSNLTASRALVSDTSGKVAVSAVTSTELGYLDGVTSAIQTQLDAKAAQSSLTSHTDNTTVHITAAERTAWNAKSNFSGSYNDLTNKPTIPSIAGLASTSYVDTAISNAIGNAIAASY